MTKSVGIFTEGGVDIGLGHLTRCSALAYGLQQRGCEPLFYIFSKDDVNDFVAPFKTQNIDWKANVVNIIKTEQLSFAIVDSYLAMRNVYDDISNILKGKMLVIDDYMRLPYPESFVVNSSVHDNSLGYSVVDGQRYLLGKDYIILRKDFWVVGPKDISDDIKYIFLTLGGTANKERLEQIGSFIKKHIDAQVHILDSYQTKYTSSQMHALMHKADLCISGGGQTMYELARLGVPTISIILSDNQILNVKTLQKAGFLFSAGRIDDGLFFNRLKDAVNYMKSPIVRKKCSVTGQRVVDGKGVHRLVDVILNEL